LFTLIHKTNSPKITVYNKNQSAVAVKSSHACGPWVYRIRLLDTHKVEAVFTLRAERVLDTIAQLSS